MSHNSLLNAKNIANITRPSSIFDPIAILDEDVAETGLYLHLNILRISWLLVDRWGETLIWARRISGHKHGRCWYSIAFAG